MNIEQIELIHFRNYDRLSLAPVNGVNLFIGQNGAGKTNLLEAIHYCSLGKSHRINLDANVVMNGEKGASCSLKIQNKNARNEIGIKIRPGEDTVKSVYIDNKKVSRLSEMMGVLRCVIFSPEDLHLIKEGPAVRRKYMDMMISQLNRGYFIALQQYRIAMNQRNAVLRQARLSYAKPDPMIQDFEKSMVSYAKIICRERSRFSELVADQSHTLYQQISGQPSEDFQVFYKPSLDFSDDLEEKMLQALSESREEDQKLGSASVGPHRDDLHITLNHRSMKLFASQGQMRTGALSLKLAQLFIFQQMADDYPILLLDDVMSELDLKRRHNLLNLIQNVQTFITCTDESDLPEYQHSCTFHIHSTEGKASVEMSHSDFPSETRFMEEPDFQY